MKKFVSSVVCLVSVFFLFENCSKEIPGPSGGLEDTRWIPIHAKGSINVGDISIAWDGDIDQDGCLMTTYLKDGAEIEYGLVFDGYHFFKDKKTNLFSTFCLSSPRTESAPRRYYNDGNSIYLETLSFSGVGSSSSWVDNPQPTGKYEAHKLDEFSADCIAFDGVTYKRE